MAIHFNTEGNYYGVAVGVGVGVGEDVGVVDGFGLAEGLDVAPFRSPVVTTTS